MTTLPTGSTRPCGCCESPGAAGRAGNPPGSAQLAYRSGTHATVLRRLRAALGETLPRLTADTTEDPALALLDAWATLADVVTFYQERILNEGFLRTATERQSVLELARAIGYELRPGVAASTYLAFTVAEPAPGGPDRATVPKETKIRSVPPQGALPQTYETSDDLVAFADRNEVGLRMWRPQQVGGKTRLYLQGLTTGLRPGDPLLVMQTPRQHARRVRWDVRTVCTVSPLTAAGAQPPATLVEVDRVLGDVGPSHALVLAFRLRAALFGSNAPDWRTMPASVQSQYGGGVPGAVGPTPPGDWPGFPLPDVSDPPTLDLDGVHPAVAAGSWFLLTQPKKGKPGAMLRLDRVFSAELGARADFAIAAKTTRVVLKKPAKWLSRFDRREATVYTQTEELPLAQEPDTDPITGPDLPMTGPVPLTEGQSVIVTGTAVSGAPVAHVSNVLSVATDGVRLATPLPETLNRDSVRVLGDVVAATHGETVLGEVLGSGDGAATFQRFPLRKPDLTYLSAATAGGAESTLKVQVEGVLWHEVPSLFLAGPQEHAYVVRIDDGGHATVVFGDGERGSRLPTGQENALATYRSGIGPAGNARAGALTLLQQRPLGVTAVTNPLPAAGAAPPERLEDAKANAPLTVLTLDRVVSLRDHEDFARGFAGIGKASAVQLWGGSRPFVHLTVAGAGGRDLPSDLVDRLRSAIGMLGPGASDLRVDAYVARRFVVGLALLIEADRVRADVETAVIAALREAFTFDRRAFGQPVTAAEVIAIAMGVQGVRAVTVTALHVVDASGVHGVLISHLAHWDPTPTDPHHLEPAELLLLDPGPVPLSEMAP